MKPLGATKVSVIGAVLTSILRPALTPLTIIFALVYGVLTDLSIILLKAEHAGNGVRTSRLVFATTISTATTGFLSYYFSVHILGVIPRNPILDAIILTAGTLSGLIGGYLAAIAWRKAVKDLAG